MLVYSIISKTSFNEISSLREEIIRVKDTVDVPIVLVANKSDLEAKRTVSQEEGKSLAKELNCPYMEASARMRVNVEETFFEVARQIRKLNQPEPVIEAPRKRRDTRTKHDSSGSSRRDSVVDVVTKSSSSPTSPRKRSPTDAKCIVM